MEPDNPKAELRAGDGIPAGGQAAGDRPADAEQEQAGGREQAGGTEHADELRHKDGLSGAERAGGALAGDQQEAVDQADAARSAERRPEERRAGERAGGGRPEERRAGDEGRLEQQRAAAEQGGEPAPGARSWATQRPDRPAPGDLPSSTEEADEARYGGHERPHTGDQRVDQALRSLDELADQPVSEHPQIFERIHSELVEVLGELRTGQNKDGNAAPGGRRPAG